MHRYLSVGVELQITPRSVIVFGEVKSSFCPLACLESWKEMSVTEFFRLDRNSIGRYCVGIVTCVALWCASENLVRGEELPPVKVPDVDASTEAEMKIYKEVIEDSDVTIEMLPIKGGKFKLGSPDSEENRNEDEGPQREVEVSPFWMAKFEITWDAYDIWMSDLDIFRRQVANREPTPRDKLADVFQVSQPTKPYTDMTFGMGKRGFPAVCMTQHSARTFCKWLSAKTGRYYRLPTEAEWEFTARGGASGNRYVWGNYFRPNQQWMSNTFQGQFPNKNSGADGFIGVAPIKSYSANSYGLYDMSGNVWEWCSDWYRPDYYLTLAKDTISYNPSGPANSYDPIEPGLKKKVHRGGSFLCSDQYCSRYILGTRGKGEWRTGTNHLGFRCVKDPIK